MRISEVSYSSLHLLLQAGQVTGMLSLSFAKQINNNDDSY